MDFLISCLPKKHQEQPSLAPGNCTTFHVLNAGGANPFWNWTKRNMYTVGCTFDIFVFRPKEFSLFMVLLFSSTPKNCHWPKREKNSMTSFDKVKDSKKLYIIIPPTVIACTKRNYVTTNSMLPNLGKDLPNKKICTAYIFLTRDRFCPNMEHNFVNS